MRSRFSKEAIPHMRGIYRMALSLSQDPDLAEDLVQETYQQAWQSFHGYRAGSDCRAWLFTILFRVRNRRLRETYRMKQVGWEGLREDELAVEPDLEKRIEADEVLKLLRSLPEHYQTVLVLADIEEFSYREVANILDLPLGTVMSRLNRARSLFRQKLKREQVDTRSA